MTRHYVDCRQTLRHGVLPRVRCYFRNWNSLNGDLEERIRFGKRSVLPRGECTSYRAHSKPIRRDYQE